MNWAQIIKNTDASDIESNISSDTDTDTDTDTDMDESEDKIFIPKIKYNSYYVIHNIVRTKLSNPIFEDWEFAYYPYLLDMFRMLRNNLKHKDFNVNVKNAKLFRRFNKLIFEKSSKYISPYINQEHLEDYKNYLCQVEN
jgi:hypothetical protein